MTQPPPLPVTGECVSRPSLAHDLIGAIALALGIICAGVTWAAIHQWREVGQYRASLPAHATEGAMGFSLHFVPWLLTLCSVALGVVTLAFLVASFSARHSRRQPMITFLHISTMVALSPLFYLLVRFATVFLR